LLTEVWFPIRWHVSARSPSGRKLFGYKVLVCIKRRIVHAWRGDSKILKCGKLLVKLRL